MSRSTHALPRTGDLYIARDHDDATMVAVYSATSAGRHPRVATGFASREEAERWIHYHRGQGGEP